MDEKPHQPPNYVWNPFHMMKNVNKNANLNFLNFFEKKTHGKFDLVSNLPSKLKKLTSKVKCQKNIKLRGV